MKVIRQFDVFDRKTDNLVEEIPITDFKLEEIKGIIKPSEHDPALYDCYEIEGSLREYFEGIGYSFDIENKIYFLCCFQDKK